MFKQKIGHNLMITDVETLHGMTLTQNEKIPYDVKVLIKK